MNIFAVPRHTIRALALCFVFVLLLCARTSWAEDQVLVISKAPLSIPGDSRNDWNSKLLILALEKTLADYGPYRIELVPQMSRARLWKSAQSNRYPNLVFAFAYAKEHLAQDMMTFIPFPVELGFLGYRVCFHPQSRAEKIQQAIASGNIKQLTHGLQKDWEDADVLRSNGYNVVKIAEYDSLFRMTAVGRFDLFCRGAAEVLDEYKRYADIEGLALEKSIAFHYQMPVFYFTNKANTRAIDRIQSGLVRARGDGSMVKMFEAHYKERIEFANLESREIIELNNPLVDGLNLDYQKYNYRP